MSTQLESTREQQDERETCMNCGHEVVTVWHVDDALWERVTNHPGDGLTLCQSCFDLKAEAKGILLQWTAIEHRFIAAVQQERCKHVWQVYALRHRGNLLREREPKHIRACVNCDAIDLTSVPALEAERDAYKNGYEILEDKVASIDAERDAIRRKAELADRAKVILAGLYVPYRVYYGSSTDLKQWLDDYDRVTLTKKTPSG